MGKSESSISTDCMDWLKEEFPRGYHHNVSDRYTSGIPDIHSEINGVSFIIELKKPGKKPEPLQSYNLIVAKLNGVKATWVDSVEDFKSFVLIHTKNTKTPPAPKIEEIKIGIAKFIRGE